jgi:Major capsid protein N-terminus/Large eukaryotic DNA virus major capsid protein
MSGGIVQLVATGAQDTWLSGKPEISFFRSNYKRYTHYAATIERQIITGQPSAGSISTIRLEKKGDLLSYMYFTARDQNGAQVNNLDWSQVIDRVELLIGGQVIDLQDYNYSTDVEPCTGAQNYNQRYLNNDTLGSTSPTNKVASFYPLKFFFCKDWSVSLPLVALQYHDVELRITWSTNLNSVAQGLLVSPTPSTVVGPTQSSIMSVSSPYSSATIYQAVTNGQTFYSNTANLILTSNTVNGPIFPGMVVGNLISYSNILNTTGLGVVQSLSANTYGSLPPSQQYSNAVISFSNAANGAITGDYTAASVVNFWLPPTQATVVNLTGVTTGSTTGTLTVSTPLRSPVTVGSIVQGLPINGIVYVSAIGTVTNTSTTMTLTLGTPAVSAPPTIPTTTIVAFIPSNYSVSAPASTVTYASLSFQAWANFVYLDQSEREFFAQSSHDLLITQVQRVPIMTNAVQELALAHPVKFLAFQTRAYGSIYNQGTGSSSASNFQLKIQINGVDVGESRPLPAWTDANQYYHTPYGYLANNQETSILVIPYCLDTSKLQPTGTLNFSRLDTYRLVVPTGLTNGLTGLVNQSVSFPYLYAVNYNVLRIQKGMGSLLYSN